MDGSKQKRTAWMKVHRRWQWVRENLEFVTVASLGVIALAIWGFAELADEVIEGDAQATDEWVLKSLRNPEDPSVPIGPWWSAEMFRDITALGSIAVLVVIALSVAGFLLLANHIRAALLILAASGGGCALSFGLKWMFGRPRPAVVPHLTEVTSSSFPSGHTLLSTVVYLSLATLLSMFIAQRRLKIYVLCIGIVLSTLVGFSRVYLGVHYPSDVLGGWAAGTAWALLWWLIARYLGQQNTLSEDGIKEGF